jgi:hypothetical protein
MYIIFFYSNIREKNFRYFILKWTVYAKILPIPVFEVIKFRPQMAAMSLLEIQTLFRACLL